MAEHNLSRLIEAWGYDAGVPRHVVAFPNEPDISLFRRRGVRAEEAEDNE